MRCILSILTIALWAVLAPRASAQSAISSGPAGSGGGYVRANVSASFTGRTTPSLSFQTSVAVPDRGEALAAGYSSYSSGRNEFGAPLVGNVPYLSRLGRNTGSGWDVRALRATVRVRVIRLSEEEQRQTGVGR